MYKVSSRKLKAFSSDHPETVGGKKKRKKKKKKKKEKNYPKKIIKYNSHSHAISTMEMPIKLTIIIHHSNSLKKLISIIAMEINIKSKYTLKIIIKIIIKY